MSLFNYLRLGKSRGNHILCFDLLESKSLVAKESYISLSSDKMNSSFSIVWNKYLEGVCHSLYKCVPELADSQSTWGLKNEKGLRGGTQCWCSKATT